MEMNQQPVAVGDLIYEIHSRLSPIIGNTWKVVKITKACIYLDNEVKLKIADLDNHCWRLWIKDDPVLLTTHSGLFELDQQRLRKAKSDRLNKLMSQQIFWLRDQTGTGIYSSFRVVITDAMVIERKREVKEILKTIIDMDEELGEIGNVEDWLRTV
jgi:hypothetical protein